MIRMIIAEHDDIDIARLCQEATKRDLDVRWFKLGLDSTQYSISWESGALPILRYDNVELSESTFSNCAWVFHREMRVKKMPYVYASVGTRLENEFCMREWSSLLTSAILTYKFSDYSHRWISSFRRTDFTDCKLFMLSQANILGLDVPAFVAATTFDAPSDEPVVVKAINADEMIDERCFPTTFLEDDQVKKYLGQRSECPSLVQQKVSSVRELRVFYVSGRWVCLEIEDQTCSVDVRYSTHLRVTLIDTFPDDFKAKLQRLCKLLEMNYCVFDILVDRDNCHWLVDVTPNGTWSWYEDASGISITREILHALERSNDDSAQP